MACAFSAICAATWGSVRVTPRTAFKSVTVCAVIPLLATPAKAAAALLRFCSPGALVSRATLEVQHDLRRNVSLIAAVTVSEADYRGIALREDGFAGSLRLDYRLTRSVALRASFTHERLKSTDHGSDYTANVYLVGLRFQP